MTFHHLQDHPQTNQEIQLDFKPKIIFYLFRITLRSPIKCVLNTFTCRLSPERI